jgi:hypothetical protein
MVAEPGHEHAMSVLGSRVCVMWWCGMMLVVCVVLVLCRVSMVLMSLVMMLPGRSPPL